MRGRIRSIVVPRSNRTRWAILAIAACLGLVYAFIDGWIKAAYDPAARVVTGSLGGPAPINGEGSYELSAKSVPDSTDDRVLAASQGQDGPAQGHLTLSGVVSDQAGKPIPGVVVGHGDFTVSNSTDAAGRYHLDIDLNERVSFIMRFLRSGYAERSYTLLSQDHATGELELPMTLTAAINTITLRGRLVDESATGIPGQKIRIVSRQLARQFVTVSASGGSFELEGVPIGVYDLTVFPNGPYKRHTHHALEVGRPTPNLDIVLRNLNLGLFSGEAVDSQGSPLPTFSLSAFSSAAPNRPHSVTTDKYGRFRIEKAAAGTLTVTTRSDGYFRLSNFVHDAFTPTEARLEFDIGPFELSGWVLDGSASPVEAASVELTRADVYGGIKRTSRRLVRVDDSGHFNVSGLATGVYNVRAVSNGYEPVSISYNVGQRSDQPYFTLTAKQTR